MKTKIVIILVLATLVISSLSVTGININKDNTKTTSNIQTEQINWDIADLIIDSKATEATIILKDLVLDLTIPDKKTIIPVNFNFNLEVKNEKLLNTETWVFIVEMRKYPAGAYIINEEITKEDEIIEGYPWKQTISATVDFSRDYPWEERGATNIYEQRYSLHLRCEYYENGVTPGEQAPDEHAVEYKNPVVVLENNDRPTKPIIINSDINDGDKKPRGEYSITVQSTDPEGDDIRYTFLWDDETSSTSGYVESGTQVTRSYNYGEDHELGDYIIKIYAQDKFGRVSDATELAFTLPKTNSFTNTHLIQILKINFPQVYESLKNYISWAL